MNKTICMLASTHNSKDARIYRREAISLRDAGYDVVIALMYNDVLPKAEQGITWVSVERPKNRFKRIFRGFALLRLALRTGADIFHFHDIEILHLMPILKLLGKKTIFDVHEPFAEKIMNKKWVPNILRSFLWFSVSLWQKFFSLFADRFVLTSEMLLPMFPAKRTEIVLNFPIFSDNISTKDKKNLIIYIGVMYPERMVEEMVEVGNYLDELDIKLEIYGPSHKLPLEKISQRVSQLEKVDFVPELLPYEQAKTKFESAMFGLCLLRNEPHMQKSFPIKVFEYMSWGVIPIVTNIDSIAELIDDNKNCLHVHDGNPKVIAQRIKDLIGQPEKLKFIQENCLESIKTRYNWDMEKEKLLKLYSQF